MNSLLKYPILLATLVLFLAAQTFGLHQGYACLCTGELVTLEADHCHFDDPECGSPMASECPSGQQNTTQHPPQKKDLEFTSLVKSLAAPMPMVALLPTSDFIIPALRAPQADTSAMAGNFSDRPDGSCATALLVTRSTVLRV